MWTLESLRYCAWEYVLGAQIDCLIWEILLVKHVHMFQYMVRWNNQCSKMETKLHNNYACELDNIKQWILILVKII